MKKRLRKKLFKKYYKSYSGKELYKITQKIINLHKKNKWQLVFIDKWIPWWDKTCILKCRQGWDFKNIIIDECYIIENEPI